MRESQLSLWCLVVSCSSARFSVASKLAFSRALLGRLALENRPLLIGLSLRTGQCRAKFDAW